jgi:AcrR family transcriptional regulator
MIVALPAVVESRRERKKTATRSRLHQAALDLVERGGLAAVTVEEITEAADVAPRTFFNYFQSKEHAVLGSDSLLPERLAAAIAARPAAEAPLEAARSAIMADLEAVDHEPAELRRQVALVRSEPQLAAAWMCKWSQQRLALAGALAERMGVDPITDFYPALVATACIAVAQLAFQRWCEGAAAKSVAAIAEEMFDCLAGGLPVPAGPTLQVQWQVESSRPSRSLAKGGTAKQ